jgi:hypothetical protein
MESSSPCSQEPSTCPYPEPDEAARSQVDIVANILNKHCGQPTRGDPPGWGLGVGLTTPYRKKIVSKRNITRLGIGIVDKQLILSGSCEHGNEPSGSM